MKEHIVRMKIELEELKEKIKKGKEFLKKRKNDNEKILDDNQRINLACQLMNMDDYAQHLEARIEYDISLEKKETTKYETTTSKKYAKALGYKSWNDFENNADYHTEKTLMDMKVWFFEGSSVADIINVLEGQKQTDYNNFTYLKDLDRWIYKYN